MPVLARPRTVRVPSGPSVEIVTTDVEGLGALAGGGAS